MAKWKICSRTSTGSESVRGEQNSFGLRRQKLNGFMVEMEAVVRVGSKCRPLPIWVSQVLSFIITYMCICHAEMAIARALVLPKQTYVIG